MRNWLQRFMYGRYGVDQLSIAILVFYILMIVVGMFVQIPYISFLYILLLILCYFRIFSRNIYKRRAENDKFLKFYNPFRFFFRNKKEEFKYRKDYKYFKCPDCGQRLRVPKGKGEVTVTCAKCKKKFDRRT